MTMFTKTIPWKHESQKMAVATRNWYNLYVTDKSDCYGFDLELRSSWK
jgi:hypothetical protein